MADVNANIGVNIDTSDALNQLKNLQRQISQFHQSVAKSSSSAAIAQRDLQKNFISSVNAIKGFSAELRTVRGTAESFTNSLEKNKFSIQQYFRYAASQTKTFGKNFTSEFSTIEKTAIERVKTLQTQYVKMGRDAQGAMQAIAIRPTVLNMKDLGTQTAIAAQKQVLFNQLVKQGSTNLLNFGKNTQWAGRQLMVGFTLPLATLGMTAGRVFMDMEKAAIKFKKVYGDLFTAPAETQQALDSIVELGIAYTKYGVAVSDAVSVASDAAAAGFQGVDLQNQTTASLKLSVLGQMELQKALETTIALQNAFRISSADLAGTIDFLNAVENQTVVSLDDITEAVPRVAPVIQALGGDVKDLAFFLAAMKEGGVNAAQGANALKSGLASLINPTERASQLLAGMGVNIRAIVSQNQGDLRGTVVGFAQALDKLDPMQRAQAIEQLFGKFQFARISALFDNVIKEGSQASRVLDLAGSSIEDLAALSDKELGVSAASAMNKFRASIEQVKVALAPIGELFLKIATPFIDFATTVLKAFNGLPDGIKQVIGTVITVVGGLGPVLLMTFGLINNGIANMIKFFATVRLGYLKMTGQAKGIGDETQYMTQEQLEAAAAAASLDQAHAGLTQRFTAEKTAVDQLRIAYEAAAAAGARFAMLNPGMMKAGSVAAPVKMAKGGVISVGGRGNKDTEPALLTPGEAVIPAEMVKKYGPLIESMIAGNIPGYAKGVMLGMPRSAKSVSKNRDASQEIYEMFLKSSYANTAPTEYGHQISPTSGHSFPIFGLGGVYQKGNKQVFVKPVLDEKAALAEMRSTEISRRAHGLEAPEQRVVVIRDPMDTTRQRRFLALESDLDPKFVNNQPMGVFNEEQYFRQLVASLLRVDKDLSGSNVYGNVVADAGPSGVFNRASGLRDYERNLPSMEDQALINLLGIKGGAKRAFAESTLGMMAGITPEQYRQRMVGEIQKVLPRLKETIASFKLTNPTEVGVYDDMVKRLEQGLGVDWSKFHAIHSAVKPAKPKVKTQAIPGYKNGIVSVPGPKGKGDVAPAMLAPGEAVIPAAMAKKYAPLIQGMISGNIPGYKQGLFTQSSRFGQGGENFAQASHFDMFAPAEMSATLEELRSELADFTVDVYTLGDKLEDGTRELTKSTQNLSALANTDRDIAAGGLTYSGTTTIESRDRNQAYNVPVGDGRGVAAGSAFTLEGVVVAGQRAEAALLQGSESSVLYAAGLQELIQEGHIAQEKLASSNSTQERLTFMQENTRKALEESYLSQTRVKTVEEAKTLAAQDLARVQKEVAALIASGMDEEQAVQAAKNKLAATLLKSGNREFVSGERGTSGGVLRDTATGRIRSLAAEEDRNLPKRKEVVRIGEVPEGERSLPRTGRTTANVASGFFTELQQKGQSAAEAAIGAIAAGARRALGIASPAKELIDAGSNAGSSLVAGAKEHIDDAKKVGENLGAATVEGAATATKKLRRSSSDPADQAKFDEINRQRTQATRDSANIAAGTSRQPRRATREADSTAPAPKASGVASKFTDNLQKASFAISSVTGILYMFGNDLGGIIPVISGISAAMFGLISISQALQGTFIATAATNRATSVANAMGAASFKDLFVKGKGVAGLFTNLITGFKAVLRFLGPVGIGLSILAIALPFVINLYQQQRDKMEAFGKIVDVTADQIKFLGQQAGESVTTSSGFERATLGQAETATDAANQKAADEQFLEQFKTQITATKAGALDSVNQALELLAFKLSSAGLSDQVVSSTIAGIIQASNRTDLEFDFNKVGLSPANTAGLLTDLKSRIATAAETQKTQTAGPGGYARGPEATQNTQALKDVGANAAALMEGLAIQLEARTITIEEYSKAFEDLRLSLVGLEGTAKETAIGEAIDKIFPEDKDMATAIKGVEDLEQQMLLLELAGVGGSDSMQEFVDKTKDGTTSKAQYVTLIKKEIAAQKKLNDVKALEIVSDEQAAEADAIRDKINVYNDLVASGLNAAEAYRIAGDAALTEGYKTAAAAGNLKEWISGVNELAALTAQFESLRPVSGGGGGQKSPFQEAIDSLKEQQKEAKSSIMAYAKLRSAGFGVAEASTIAKDSMLAAALASQQVGSAKWNQLVTAIRAAKAEEEAWLNSTPEGRAEHFADVYSKVMDVFNAQENIINMNNEAATATTKKMIEALEKQIEVYQRRSAELERDLESISEKEDEINKAYDEKNKSLEKVKKLNQDILNQQKSQLSIADALSQGDIGAAASAIQESRAQNAAAQGDAIGNALDASRKAQLNALTKNGKTRAQIEAEIKRIKKEIETIEFGALQNARDAVKLADELAAIAIENLRVQGLSKTEWQNINTRIDASKANAALYNSEVAKALLNAQGLVGEWSKLNDTYTTTHVVNTINTSSGDSGGPGPGPSDITVVEDPQTAAGAWGTKKTEITNRASNMNRVLPIPYSTNGIPKLLSDYLSAYNEATSGSEQKADAWAPKAQTAYLALHNRLKANGFSSGGKVMSYMAEGGLAFGSDTVPAMLTPGEFVVNKASTRRFAPLLEAMNTGNFKYSTPSGPSIPNNFSQPVYNMPEKAYAPTGGAMPLNSRLNTASSLTSQDNSVYNYSLSVNVDGTNASPDQIANVVMRKLQGIDSQRVKRQVIR